MSFNKMSSMMNLNNSKDDINNMGGNGFEITVLSKKKKEDVK